MAETTNNISSDRDRRPAEYRAYLWLIFVLALPFGVAGWALDLLRGRGLRSRGPVARARLEAERIAPVIFWA